MQAHPAPPLLPSSGPLRLAACSPTYQAHTPHFADAPAAYSSPLRYTPLDARHLTSSIFYRLTPRRFATPLRASSRHCLAEAAGPHQFQLLLQSPHAHRSHLASPLPASPSPRPFFTPLPRTHRVYFHPRHAPFGLVYPSFLGLYAGALLRHLVRLAWLAGRCLEARLSPPASCTVPAVTLLLRTCCCSPGVAGLHGPFASSAHTSQHLHLVTAFLPLSRLLTRACWVPSVRRVLVLAPSGSWVVRCASLSTLPSPLTLHPGRSLHLVSLLHHDFFPTVFLTGTSSQLSGTVVSCVGLPLPGPPPPWPAPAFPRLLRVLPLHPSCNLSHTFDLLFL